ncbi:MAG: VWA domain-containing protein [Defluviitaleaceae bacterium]|nr:VWA domain-containing protein [Defluviitaleaceae bacterium]
MTKHEELNRWRLILGSFSEDSLGGEMPVHEFDYGEVDNLLDFLYGREYGEDRGIREREGGLGPSQMLIPEWIRKIRRIFPKTVVERLENEALDRYQLTEILNDKKVLETIEPNMNLLKNILALKNRMKGDVLTTAKEIVRKVVEDLTKKLENDIMRSFTGRLNRLQSTTFRHSKNFDLKKTLRKNLKNYDPDLKTIIPHRLYFNPRVKRYNPWHIVICIDQSGSMVESVIYSAIMSGIFSKLPILSVKLVVFDTEVVDLSGYVDDPAEALMSVQLGGGTNIGKAMNYCESLIETPARTIMIMVTDLYDGAGYTPMYSAAKRIIESGTKLFILTGLDTESQGLIDSNAGKRMAGIGAKVATLTPDALAEWVAEAIIS